MSLPIAIAVPPPVAPLGPQQHIAQRFDLRAARETEPAAHRDRVALDRRVPALQTFDDRRGMAWIGDPAERGLRRRTRRSVASRNAELDQRDETPVRAALPLRVRLDAETTVRTLSRQEPFDRRPTPGRVYSHSMVPGGLLVMSKTTRLTPLTSLTMRLLIRASTS